MRSVSVMTVMVILVVASCLYLPILLVPLGRDQAIFALVGRTILEGGAPYRDAFDFKPPGVHLAYAAALAVFGRAPWSPLVLDALATLIGSFFLFRLLQPSGRPGAITAALVYVVVSATELRYWDLAQPEGLSVPLVLGALLAWRRVNRAGALTAGVAIGAATLLKYPALGALALLWLVPRATAGEPAPPRWLRIAWTGVGLLCPIGGVVIWLALRGALGDFVEIQTDYLPGYSRLIQLAGAGRAISDAVRLAADFLGARPLVWIPPVVTLPWLLRNRCLGRTRWLPAGGVLLGLVGAALQGKFFHYHWIPLLPFAAMGTGLGLQSMLAGRSGARAGAGVLAGGGLLLAVLAAFSARPTWPERRAALEGLASRASRSEIAGDAAFGAFGGGDYSPGATYAAAERLAALTRPDDRVFVWGFEPLLYLVADRAPASRFIYNAPLLSPWCPHPWIDRTLADLRRDPPAAIVVVRNDAIPWVTGVPFDSETALGYFPDLARLIRAEYRPAAEVEDFVILTHIPREPPR